MTTTPSTEAGKRMLARGSNNWTGSGWLETFRTDIIEIESRARAAGRAEAVREIERAILGRENFDRETRGYSGVLDGLYAARDLLRESRPGAGVEG